MECMNISNIHRIRFRKETNCDNINLSEAIDVHAKGNKKRGIIKERRLDRRKKWEEDINNENEEENCAVCGCMIMVAGCLSDSDRKMN